LRDWKTEGGGGIREKNKGTVETSARKENLECRAVKSDETRQSQSIFGNTRGEGGWANFLWVSRTLQGEGNLTLWCRKKAQGGQTGVEKGEGYLNVNVESSFQGQPERGNSTGEGVQGRKT